MADIILYNDQDQDQMLTGVSKLVARGASGDVEFSVGGGSGGDAISIITNTYNVQTDQEIQLIGVRFNLTGSPMTIQLYVDIGVDATILSISPMGGVLIYKGNAGVGRMVPMPPNWEFSAVDEKIKRYGTGMTFSYTDETYGRLYEYAYVVMNFLYDGTTVEKRNGELVLTGPNAAKFMSSPAFLGSGSLNGKGLTQQFDVYDMRQDAAENVSINPMNNLDVPRAVYLPAGISSIPDYCFYQMRNLELIDFSIATSVPTLGGAYTFQGLKSGFQIVVPSALYEEWKAAKNWSNVASHIVAV